MTKFDITAFDIVSDLKTDATRPIYAGVGATDLAVGVVLEYVADVQKKLVDVQKDVQTKVADLDFEPKALREQAMATVNAGVEALSKDAKARRAAIEARVAELQSEALSLPNRVQELLAGNVGTVNEAYADLAKRGEILVERIRKQQSTEESAAPAAPAEPVKAPAKKAAAKKTTAKKATTKKAAPKKAAEPKPAEPKAAEKIADESNE